MQHPHFVRDTKACRISYWGFRLQIHQVVNSAEQHFWPIPGCLQYQDIASDTMGYQTDLSH